MTPGGAAVSYTTAIGANIRAERARAGLSQQSVAARMRRLGYKHWLYQTVGASERGTRRVTADELPGLCLALGCSMPSLLGSGMEGDHLVELPSGDKVGASTIQRLSYGVVDRAIQWAGDDDFTLTVFAFPVTIPATRRPMCGPPSPEASRPRRLETRTRASVTQGASPVHRTSWCQQPIWRIGVQDDIAPRRPHDPRWRSSRAHRHLDPEVAAMLARRRAELGWTQSEAAWRTGISRRMLGMLERGERVPSVALAGDLADGYRLDAADAALLASVALPDVGRASPYRTGEAARPGAGGDEGVTSEDAPDPLSSASPAGAPLSAADILYGPADAGDRGTARPSPFA